MKINLDFNAYGLEVKAERELTPEQVEQALTGKIWRTAVVLKNAYNANATENAKLEKYLATNGGKIDILKLATSKDYKAGLIAEAMKLEGITGSMKTENDFIEQAIEKVLSGGGQND